MPHHGSKRNLSSKVLKKIQAVNAFISAPQNSAKHPSKKIINALKKHGSAVYVVKEGTVCHRHNTPVRAGWSGVAEEQFYDLVEE